MRILHIEDFFHPNAGYQLNLLAKYMKLAGNEVYILTSEIEEMPSFLTGFFGTERIEERDLEYEKKTGVKIVRIAIKRFISGRSIYGRNLYRKIKEINPDIIYCHGNDTYAGMKLIKKAKKMGYPLILDNHMVEIASTNKLAKFFRFYYRHFVAPTIIKNGYIVIRTANDSYVNKCLGVPFDNAPFISFGSDILTFHPDEEIKEKERAKLSLQMDDFVIVYAGKFDKSKGGLFLAEALREKMPAKKKVVFVLIGNVVKDEYGSKVEEVFNESENTILRFPTQTHTGIAKFFQLSDLFIIPSKCTLTLFDAQACGLPALAEDNSINIDRLSKGNGFVFKKNDIEDLRIKMAEIIDMDPAEYDLVKNNAYNNIIENYNYADIAKKYLDVVNLEYERQSRIIK